MLTISTRLGPYEIVAPLGAGGMGEVYRARDTRLGREVAIKVLPEPFAQDPDRLTRFEREAKALATLSHPNILAIHDYGTEQGVCYAVMELLEGETLRQRLTEAALPWRKALELGAAIADGLAAAHARGITHRDIKPENVFLTTDGRVKVLDFGLAGVSAVASSDMDTTTQVPNQTDPGTVMGTAGYMSPEQVRRRAVDARSDIFSLGCVLYELVTGRRAFSRETSAETMTAILHDDVPESLGSGCKVPLEVERVIRHCLEKNPEERFQSARDLAFGLKALLSGSDPSPALHSTEVRPKKKAPPRRKAIVSLAVLPFVNAGADPEAEYLCDGITDSLINSLSRLPRLKVMARSTVFRFKGKEVDAQEVGRTLDVRAVLTGRVFHRSERLIIATELVDVADGSQFLGEQYNRPAADIFALQEEMAREITETLRLRLSGADRKQLTRRYTESTEAYQLYLKGRYYWNKRTEEGIRKGIGYFQQAIECDPAYALAYAGVADCYNMLGAYGILPPRDAYPKAEAAARKALEIDDALAEAHTSLAWLRYEYHWNWASAEDAFRQALALSPDYATAHLWYAHCLLLWGRFDDALVELERGRNLDPLSLIASANLGYRLYLLRRYDEAIRQYHQTLELEPNFFPAHRYLGEAYLEEGMYPEAIAAFQRARVLAGEHGTTLAELGHACAVAGRYDEARKALAELLERARRRYVSAFDVGLVHLGLGETEEVFAWLDKAHEERACYLSYLKVDPRFDVLRSDPRFAELIRRVGLAP